VSISSIQRSTLRTDLVTDSILVYSRQDANFGPADVFNEKIWNETLAHFDGPTIDLAKASRARTARVVTSAATNPQFTLPQLGAHFIYGETAAYQFVFGEWDLESEDPKNMVLTPKNLVQYFFGKEVLITLCFIRAEKLTMIIDIANERLPTELGWSKPKNRLMMDTLQNLVFVMQDITLKQMNEKSS
jgi:hypothetical protein